MANEWPTGHSIYGRKLVATPEGYLTGEYGWKSRVQAATSATTATNILPAGITTIANTTAAAPTYGLTPPEPGVTKTLVCLNAGTSGIATITSSNSYIITGGLVVASASSAAAANRVTTASTAYTTIKMWQVGQVVELLGVSTSVYTVVQISGFSTSTGGGAILS